MARDNAVTTAVALSFLVGGLIGVAVALLMAPQPRQMTERLKIAIGKREKLTREQIIEEGIECAAPEGFDMYYPVQEEEEA